MRIIFIAIFALILIGCGKLPKIEKCNLGKYVESNVIPTAFNESQKMEVKTDKGKYVIYGLYSFELNKDVVVDCRVVR